MGFGQGNINFNPLAPAASAGTLTGFHNTFIPFGNATGGLHDTVDTGIGSLQWANGIVAATDNTGIPITGFKINSTGYVGTIRIQTDVSGSTAKSLLAYGKASLDYWMTGLDNTNYVLRNATNNANVWLVSSAFGRTGIGMVGIAPPASPTAMIHIAASDGAQNNAPLKFTTGTLMATPQVGAFEYNVDKIYFTISTGTTRKEITLNDQALTAGRIALVGTNGRITDSADFTTSGSILLATNIQVAGNITSNGFMRAGGGGATSGHLIAGAATAVRANLNLGAGVAPTTPTNGDIWFDGTNLFMQVAGVTKTFTLV